MKEREREGVTTTAEWTVEGSIMGESWRGTGTLPTTAIGKTEAGAGQEQGRRDHGNGFKRGAWQ